MNQKISIIQPEPSRTARTGHLSEVIRGSGFLLGDKQMAKRIDRTGLRFGRLVIIKFLRNDKYWHPSWLCKCDCGGTVEVKWTNLYSGRTKSCGCLRRELQTTHGQHRSPEYKSWKGMIQRCTNPKDASFSYYVGRGSGVCDRWRDFRNFYEDMGERPKGLTIERTNNCKGYSPDNCCWATRTEQQHNTRLQTNNTSGVTGIRWKKELNKYSAKIGVNGKVKYLGVFLTLTAAQVARKAAETKYWKKE